MHEALHEDILYNTNPTTVGVKTQKVKTATTIEKVLTAVRAQKNRFTSLLLVGVSAKIRFRCFSAMIKIEALRITINVSGK